MNATTSRFTDKQHLTAKSYHTQDKLNIRIRTHERYTRPQLDFTGWILDKITWRGDETVIDIGCGSGVYIEPARRRCRHYIAGDLSLGMLRQIGPPAPDRLNLDAQQLPLVADVADVVLANHMLYHVPRKELALAEIARVLRPCGKLIAATNSSHNMAELLDLRRRAMARLGLPIDPALQRNPAAYEFSLENGRSWLEAHFKQVERHDLPSALVFPTPGPLLDYIGSSRDWYESFLPDAVTWDDLHREFKALLDDHFANHDTFHINKLSGVFICNQ